LSAGFALVLAAAAHAVGWPIPRGGAQSITTALCGYLATLDVALKTSWPVQSLAAEAEYDVNLCDVTPRQLLAIAGQRLSPAYRERLEDCRYGPGAFKGAYRPADPIPWRAAACSLAATVDIGGGAAEIAASEHAMRTGQPAERPFVLLAQPSLFDAARAPA